MGSNVIRLLLPLLQRKKIRILFPFRTGLDD